MMNQSTVPLDDVKIRLSILCEYLLDTQKPIEEAYESLMEKLGRKIMEYTEFEYWFKRFQNNLFDLGYDASQDLEEIQNTMDPTKEEDPVEIVERKMQNLKLNHQFKEENVPKTFRALINEANLKKIDISFSDQFCTIKFDEILICLDKKGKFWSISYQHTNEKIKTDDPEKSIIDHLWFVLKNPNMELGSIKILAHDSFSSFDCKNLINLEKLETLLQSMFHSFDHQIETSIINFKGFNEDTFFSLLKNIKPETLGKIDFDISWKKKDNYQKLKEIVELDQWKQAKTIYSRGVTPLKIEDVLHCEVSQLTYDRVTPQDVLRVTENLLHSQGTKCCTLYSENKKIDINAILNVLQDDEAEIIKIKPILPQYKFRFKTVKSEKYAFLNGNKNFIAVQNF